MDIQKRGFVTLIKSAFSGEKCELPSEFDLAKAFSLAERHNIMPIIYNGAYCCGIDSKSEVMKKAFGTVCKAMIANELQVYNVALIETAFEENGIDYMLLKGARLKKSYPRPEMRSMSDIDILIKLDQYKIVKKIMAGLGFEEKTESDHELIWEKEVLTVELHKRVIPSYNKDYYAYFGDGWKFATSITAGKKYSYEMNANDEFVFMFVHFCKHFRDSGVGVRHLIDLWYYRIKNPNLDENYILNAFKTLKVDEFYKNILATIDFLFGGGAGNEKIEFITEIIFGKSIFDSEQAKIYSSTLKKDKGGENIRTQKIKRFFSAIFVPYKAMCSQYKFLKKVPFLLPFMWVFHLFRRVFTKGRLKQYKKEIANMSIDNAKKYQEYLNYVGLDYNFEE